MTKLRNSKRKEREYLRNSHRDRPPAPLRDAKRDMIYVMRREAVGKPICIPGVRFRRCVREILNDRGNDRIRLKRTPHARMRGATCVWATGGVGCVAGGQRVQRIIETPGMVPFRSH